MSLRRSLLESQWNSIALLEALKSAADNMSLVEKARVLGERIKMLQNTCD